MYKKNLFLWSEDLGHGLSRLKHFKSRDTVYVDLILHVILQKSSVVTKCSAITLTLYILSN